MAAAAVALAALAAFSAAWLATPSVAGLEQLVARRLHGEGGRVVPLSRIALELQQAVVATEDERSTVTAGSIWSGCCALFPTTRRTSTRLAPHRRDDKPERRALRALQPAAPPLTFQGGHVRPLRRARVSPLAHLRA